MKSNKQNSQNVVTKKGRHYFLSMVTWVCLMGFALTNAYALNCAFENPTNGDLFLANDTFADISGLMPAGSDFTFFGVPYGPDQPEGGIYVGDNGVVTFGSGNGDSSESLTEFATVSPIIAAMWDDFDPVSVGPGAVKAEFQPQPDRLIITWDRVLTLPLAIASNTFQLILYLDSNRYEIIYNGMSTTDGIIGISPGLFSESDLSASKVTKGKKVGTIGEVFTGLGNSFDLDGRCLQGKPLTSATATPTLILK
jgi:hypothetical protein